MEIEPHQITMEATDDGPGINDVELAMRPGWSTATEEIREMGFGAGMGLVNISRCVDHMKLESSSEKGTNLKVKIFLKDQDFFGETSPNPQETTAMNLQEIIDHLDLTLLTNSKDFTANRTFQWILRRFPELRYVWRQHQSIWITLQWHGNIVAVAALLDLSAIIITEDAQPDAETINKANEEGITLLSTKKKSYEICGQLWRTGLHE